MNDAEEIVLPFPAPVERLGETTHVRSTLLASSMQSLRVRGLFDQYATLLPAAFRVELLNNVAGEWLPVDRALAHYTACNDLQLTVEEQIAMGRDVSRRIHDSFLGLVVNMARGAGVTPWVVLPRSNALYQRVWKGGGTQVVKLGPKEAKVEVVGLTALTIPYFRNAMLGMYEAAIGLFARRVLIRHVPLVGIPLERRFVLRILWD